MRVLKVTEEAEAKEYWYKAVLLLLYAVRVLLGSAAVVLEVDREELVLLVVKVLLVIAVEIELTQASMLILAVLDSFFLVMTALVAVAVLG